MNFESRGRIDAAAMLRDGALALLWRFLQRCLGATPGWSLVLLVVEGVLQLAQQWNITSDEICAVGDDVNDIPMIESAGLGVAMGNAVAETKAAADRIAPHHDADGIVQVVDWVLEAS